MIEVKWFLFQNIKLATIYGSTKYALFDYGRGTTIRSTPWNSEPSFGLLSDNTHVIVGEDYEI